MTEDWVLPGRFGTERWQRDGTGFALSAVGEEALSGPADAVLLDRIGARRAPCGHADTMPDAFRFCPECGAALEAAAPADWSPPWSPPFGAPDGLPEMELSGAPDPGSRDEIPMPPSGAIGLAVAGTPSLLLCCDRSSGWVWAFSGRDDDWHRLLQLPACALPRWSWSAAADGTGLALPTERGPAWIGLTGAAARGRVLLPATPCTPLGGAARIGGAAAMPVLREGVLAVALLTGDAWVLEPVDGAPDAPLSEPFASPVVVAEAGFWCGRDGQLSVRATADGLRARFRRWSDGVVPLSGARPVLGRDGTPHLACRLDDATLVYETLSLPGQPSGRRVARGYAPGTGRAVFRENHRSRLPWDERAICDYPLPEDRFLHPLLRLGEDGFLLALCGGRDRLGRFLRDPLFDADPEATPLLCTPLYSRGPRRLEALDCVLRAHDAADLSAVCWNGRLLLHGAVENRCHRWVLRDAD